jgi:predicted N-formylglutamate amidohydrolase
MMRDDQMRLIGEGDPDPVRVLRPAGASEFFLTADHAGRAIPRQLGNLGLPHRELARHIAWDIGVAGVTEKLAQALDATAVLQEYSRLVIDCNRAPGWASSIPALSELTAIPGNLNIPPAQREARRREIFLPYHECIAELLDRRSPPPPRRTGRRTVLIAMHSFTPVFKGEPRTIEIGILYNRDARLANILLDLLRAEGGPNGDPWDAPGGGLVVGDNAPYAITDASDYTVPVHGEGRGLPHVEIEIRQDLIGDEVGQTAWAARLARLLPIADSRLRVAGG